MSTLSIATQLVNIITLVIAYCIVVSVAGCFRAWVALKMGDDVPAQTGFMTFYPWLHVDPFGFVLFMVLNVGWGRYIPINNDTIDQDGKFLVASFSDTCMHVICSIVGVFILVASYGYSVFEEILHVINIHHQYPSYYHLAQVCCENSSLLLALAFLILVIVYFNVVLAGLSFVINLFHYIMARLHREVDIHSYNPLYSTLFFCALVLFVPGIVRCFVIGLMSYIGKLFAYNIGMM